MIHKIWPSGREEWRPFEGSEYYIVLNVNGEYLVVDRYGLREESTFERAKAELKAMLGDDIEYLSHKLENAQRAIAAMEG